jgi:uncharacterized protein
MALQRRSPRFLASLAILVVGASAAASDAELFRKLSAKAEAGSAQAQYNLGMLYNNGIGTTKDPRLAFEWFEKSATSGDPLASYKVGCFYDGQFPGVVPVDFERALQSKLVSARAGYSRAQHDVGVAYFRKHDYGQAAKWWSAGAEQGEPYSLVALAEAYRTGNGVPVNPERSLELLLIVSRVVSADQMAAVQPVIASLKKEIDPQKLAPLEKAAAAWVPKLAEPTIRANLGIREAQQLVK